MIEVAQEAWSLVLILFSDVEAIGLPLISDLEQYQIFLVAELDF